MYIVLSHTVPSGNVECHVSDFGNYDKQELENLFFYLSIFTAIKLR